MKSERDKIAAKARKMYAKPATRTEWQHAWTRVLARLEPLYDARRPIMKSFEVHHVTEKAREVMLRALVDGKTVAECEELAFAEGSRCTAP